MKKLLLPFLIFLSGHLHCQERFNVILEDTIGHITNSVIESNGKYFVLSGTRNSNNIRCIAFTKVDLTGNSFNKSIFGTDSIEVWEGDFNCLKQKQNEDIYFAGTVKSGDGKYGLYIFESDNSLTETNLSIIDYDTIWKAAFNSTISSDAIYFTGQHYRNETETGNLMLLKTDLDKNIIWKKIYGYVYEYADQIILTNDNNLIIGGSMRHSFSDDSNWYIIKTDTAGNVLWETDFGHPRLNDGGVASLLETSDSCILAGGSYPAIETQYDSYNDGCIRKLKQNGELIWERFYRNYSGHPTEEYYRMVELSISSVDELCNSNLIVCGSSLSFYPIERGFMMLLNKNGNILWHNYYYADTITSNWQYMSSLSKASDGGYILAGYGNDYSPQGYYPPQQRWLIKTDSMGMDGLCNTEPDALEVDIDFPDYLCANDTAEVYIYIAGPTAPYKLNISNGQTFDSIYYPPVFVPIEVGPGTIQVNYGLPDDHEFEEPEVTIANHEWGECIAIPIEYHVGNQLGYETLDITVTDGWGNSKTISKTIFVKTCPNGISSAELENSLQIYPNPASDFLTVELEGNMQDFPISIVDMSGKVVLQTLLMDAYTSIDIRTLPAGNYQLMIEGVSKSFSVVR